ncbi:dephospho-CoA kinase [Acidovorax sp. D2M1]|uniref:Dephospho-CoA kinase n=1 Tax=Acidovorax benzenivorans TaxID=2987520 RepID=A0ABT5S0K3_9BURK|nr:dephospho-CoA kinase [Acidovorax benzenivorans]MDD2179493.1 dephospho-CoA kinase [Acidovorax benzenivorans]
MATYRQPLRLGLTGGIGSGKSTVGQILASLGAALIDADQISREVTGPGGAAMPAIQSTFGGAYVDASGALDRTRMRQLAFSQPKARSQLEAIVHPLVALHSQQRIQQAIQSGAPLIVHDIPLLAESGRWARQLDAVVVVDCTADIQIERVMQRSGLSADAVRGIIASQATRTARRAVADVVIANEAHCTLEQLQAEVRQVAALFGL